MRMLRLGLKGACMHTRTQRKGSLAYYRTISRDTPRIGNYRNFLFIEISTDDTITSVTTIKSVTPQLIGLAGMPGTWLWHKLWPIAYGTPLSGMTF